MSSFSDGQLRQWGNAVKAAGWTTEDITLMGQAGRDRLIGIRDSLRRGGDIVTAIIEGRTELWLAPGQATWVRGHEILKHLTRTGLLASCADFAELEAIQAKGINFFRKHFAKNVPFGWRGVKGDIVPFLFESNDEVVLGWSLIDNDWLATNPALRRK